MDDITFDPAIYGGQSPTGNTFTPVPVPDVRGVTEATANQPAPDSVAYAEAVSKGSMSQLIGQSARDAASRTLATRGESAAASVKTWSTTHLIEAMNAPTFTPDADYDIGAFMKQVPFTPTEGEDKVLRSASSWDEAKYKLGLIQEQRENYTLMGDNMGTAMLVGAVDPIYLGLDALTLGAGRLAGAAGAGVRAQRALAAGGAAAGAFTIGKVEQSQVGITDNQIIGMALLNGAASAVAYRAGKMVSKDPDYPDAPLRDAANRLNNPTLTEVDGVMVRQAAEAPVDNLTRPRVLATGEGNPTVRYADGSVRNEYNLSPVERATLRNGNVREVVDVADMVNHSPSVRRGHTVIDPDAKAVYLPGEDAVFLIQSNIKSTDDVKGILLHEVGVHMNAERVLGVERMGKMLDSLEDLALAGNKRAADAFANVPKNTPLHLVREEALGYYIEKNYSRVKDGFVAQLLTGAKELLRKLGLNGLKYSETELVQLVRRAAKNKSPKSFDTTFPYVWHGSPTRGIGSLDTASMGTGEGKSAFGFGHYVSSEKGTALDYRNKESVRRGIDPEAGGLYRIKINAQADQFLDLDARVQSSTVQRALTNLGVREGVTGKTAYDYLAKTLGSQRAASEALSAEGVVGNRYATGRTRGTAERNSNYVVFDNATLDTAARYSMGVMPQPTGTAGQQAAAIIKNESRASRTGRAVEWSLSKTLGKYSEEARATSRMLVDDPVDMTADSVVSQHRAIRADMSKQQYAYHDVLLEALKEQGFGTFKRISNSADGAAAQARIEADVAKELLRRESYVSRGVPIPEDTAVSATTKRLADTYGTATQFALREQKAAGVLGADAVKDNVGYFTRNWANDKIERITTALEGAGMDAKAASKSVKDALTKGILARNNWTPELAGDVAGAILDRARRKGYGEDITAMGRAGADTAKAVEAILREAGVTGSRMERAMDVLTGAVDEAGKSAQLKHRVDIDMSIPLNTPTGNHTLLDLIDTDMTRLLDKYLDGAAANTAFARKGLVSATDVNNLRTATAKSIAKESDRKEFLKMFDDTVDTIRGRPAGDNVPAAMRKLAAVTQMTALSASGLWQMTEYATAMSRFGIMKTTGMAIKELPGFRSLLGSISKDKGQAEHLANILSRNSSQDIRIQPYIRRMEDNFDVPMSDTVMMSLQNAKQLVPYINGMRYIHHHQANMVGNLVADSFHRAAKGDAKAIEMMEKYGMKPHTIANIKDDILKHGLDTAKWSDRTWAEVRGPLTKMMDESVLRNRLGEIPAFAQFTSVGKFVFTFRSFVLGAHNKILAGTLGREGAAGLGLLLMYQYPLTYAATLANETMSGRTGQKSTEQIAGAAMSQMGSLGLFGEVAGIAFGNKQQFGAPGLIPIDRVYKAGSAVASGQFGSAASGALDTVPILSIIPFHKALTDIPKGD